MGKLLDGANLLITGGTGTIGHAAVQEIQGGKYGQVERVLVLSRDEAKQHDMRTRFAKQNQATDDLAYRDYAKRLRFRIGDMRNPYDVENALDGIDYVIHAAALKQVPSCEYFPEQAIGTNCIGAINLAEAIRKYGKSVKAVVGLSTDKACQPLNVMGMTKALQERILVAANMQSGNTCFSAVRYGNIIASRGSAIPLFKEQLAQGGVITLTSPEMTRFMMTDVEAVETLMEALANALPGEIIVRASPSVYMENVVKALAKGREYTLQITGIRPGEKLHEILVSEDEVSKASKRGKFIHLRSMLPELESGSDDSGDIPLKVELSSKNDVLGFEETAALLASWEKGLA